MAPELVYCAGGNARFARIAIDAGFRYGSRLPDYTIYGPLWFADQEWRKPNRTAYMAALAKHRPWMATVLDWEDDDQLDEVLSWADEAARYVEQVVIVPKVIGGIDRLPRRVGGKRVVLAYSVPTSYGGTQLPIWEFADWPVHLLGGSPHRQMQIYVQMRAICDVVSVDGNMAAKLANARAQFWCDGTARFARDRYWPKLREAGWDDDDAPDEAFRRSCANIMQSWRTLG